MCNNIIVNSDNALPYQHHPLQQKQKINYWVISTIILGILIFITIGIFLLTINVARDNSSALIIVTPVPSKNQAHSPPDPGLPPDPGEAGKATLEGIDSDKDDVRDDVQRHIAITVTDSARHREALRSVAISLQRGLLAPTTEDAIQVAISLDRSIQCLGYLGVLNQDKWKEVEALMLNTEARLRAIDVYNDRITGQVFAGLPPSLKRSACAFDVEALPN